MKDLTRNVALLCPTCGNDQFSKENAYDDTDDRAIFKCSDCNSTYTRSELLELNQELINSNIEEIQEEAVEEFGKEFNKALKNIFK